MLSPSTEPGLIENGRPLWEELPDFSGIRVCQLVAEGEDEFDDFDEEDFDDDFDDDFEEELEDEYEEIEDGDLLPEDESEGDEEAGGFDDEFDEEPGEFGADPEEAFEEDEEEEGFEGA